MPYVDSVSGEPFLCWFGPIYRINIPSKDPRATHFLSFLANHVILKIVQMSLDFIKVPVQGHWKWHKPTASQILPHAQQWAKSDFNNHFLCFVWPTCCQKNTSSCSKLVFLCMGLEIILKPFADFGEVWFTHTLVIRCNKNSQENLNHLQKWNVNNKTWSFWKIKIKNSLSTCGLHSS